MITTTTAMSQSLDVKIAERVKSRLLERDGLIDFFESIDYIHNDDDGNDNVIDFFTYYTTHYGTELDDNVHLFINDHRNDLWDELNYDDKKNEYFSDEEIDEISVVDTIKLFKVAISFIDDEDEDNLNDHISAYTENHWRTLASFYVGSLVNNLITNYRYQIGQIIYTYINDKQEALRAKKINEMSKHLAIEKIKRNKVFNCGLGLKLSMRDCGIELST